VVRRVITVVVAGLILAIGPAVAGAAPRGDAARTAAQRTTAHQGKAAHKKKHHKKAVHKKKTAPAAPAAPTAPALPAFANADGITVTSVKQLDPRLLALVVKTSALPVPSNLRILLPTGYAQHPNEHYPVLYLLHGTSGGASDWTTMGAAEQTTAGLPLIVVMTDIALNDDGGGWCTNWPDGEYAWETYHIDQLIPWVQANLRTLDTRGERAIAGLSQGGFCSISYAAQFPDLFGVALAYSGVPDLSYELTDRLGALGIIDATAAGLDAVPIDSFFGDPITDYLNYADHDPAWLINNLRATKLYFYFGNGLPGSLDANPINPAASAIEALVNADNLDFHERMTSVGMTPTVYDPYGNGTHSWPYWARDLQWSIGDIMSDFAHPAPDPAEFSYTSGDAAYSDYGWQVTMHRAVAEFSTLENVTAGGFTLTGSGSATVTTPAQYTPGAEYRVVTSAKTGTTSATPSASPAGELQLTVPLGPSDTTQEFSLGGPPAPSPGTTVDTTNVTITPVVTPARPARHRKKRAHPKKRARPKKHG
jgi:S-formylglutathione hydrolase FrmB